MKGFTLLETMIAVSILALATAGPLYAASRSLVAAQISRDQLTASHLAQEGVEHFRMIRDNYWLASWKPPASPTSAAWGEFIGEVGACGAPGKTCQMTSAPPGFVQCSIGSCPPLDLTGSKKYVQLANGIAGNSRFTRTVTVSYVSDTERRIESRVSWTFHNVPHSVVVTGHLTQWF